MSFDPKRPPSGKPPGPGTPGAPGIPASRPPSTAPSQAPVVRTSSTVKPPSNVKDAMREALASSGGAALSRPSTAPGSTRPGKKTILVVDDDAAMRTTLKRALEAEYDVVEAKDGMEAVELIGTMQTPNMVVCDIMMPRVDGFTFAKIMRSNPLLKKVPIMFVSSRNSPQEVTQALVLGAAQYVPKTTPVSQIVEKIRKIIL
jgi:CheY-like chemotaxis protein